MNNFPAARIAPGETLSIFPGPSSRFATGPRSPAAQQKTFTLLHFPLHCLRRRSETAGGDGLASSVCVQWSTAFEVLIWKALHYPTIRKHDFGGPEVLHYEDAPIPELKPGEVLVRVHAVGSNPADRYLRGDHKTLPPEWRPEVSFPLILGTDVSGVVEAFAEYVTVPALEVALKPTGIYHAHAAGALMSLLTARQYMIELGHNTPNPLQPRMHEPVPLEGKAVLVQQGCRRRGALERRRPRFEFEPARFPKSLAI
jgi:hypothetical protein